MRCSWAEDSDATMQAYHDTEWGVPHHDDRALFELISLEGAQAGLSWRTVLARREGYRAAFHNFTIARVAGMSDSELNAVLTGLITGRRAREGACWYPERQTLPLPGRSSFYAYGGNFQYL